MNAPEYKPTFSFGNVVTIIGGVFVALSLITGILVSQASADKDREAMRERILRNELAIKQFMEIKTQLVELSINQRTIMIKLEKLEDQGNKK